MTISIAAQCFFRHTRMKYCRNLSFVAKTEGNWQDLTMEKKRTLKCQGVLKLKPLCRCAPTEISKVDSLHAVRTVAAGAAASAPAVSAAAAAAAAAAAGIAAIPA